MAQSAYNKYKQYIYGGWDPNTRSSIYLRNDAYRRLQKELEYHRKHPKQADPRKLLKLIADMQKAWDSERNQYSATIDQILEECRNELNRISSEYEVRYQQLIAEIDRLRNRLKQQCEEQKKIEREIEKIKREADNDRRLANLYRQQAYDLVRSIKDNPYWHKYDDFTLNKALFTVNNQFNLDLHPAAMQSLALTIIAEVGAGQKIVDEKRLQYAFQLDIAKNQTDTALQTIRNYEENIFLDSDTRQDKVDVDHWSFGEFSRTCDFIRNQLCPRMLNSTETYGYMVEDLRSDCEALKEHMSRLENIVADAIAAALASRRSRSMAQDVARLLELDFFYTVTLQGFDDDDDRLGYVLYMHNNAYDSDIRLIFNPLHGSDEVQALCHYRQNIGIDPNLLADQMKKIVQRLLPLGIHLQLPEGNNSFGEQPSENQNGRIHLPQNLKVRNEK